MSCCPDHQENNQSQSATMYTCPMHPEIVQDHPGKCPKCGGMDLVPMDQKMDHSDHQHHDHQAMMMGESAAAEFLRRFWIVTALLIPLFLTSHLALKFLGLSDFALRPYLQFGLATVIFFFALVFFQHASHEIKARQYGMMTLVSLAVGAGYLFSAASTFLPALQIEFYLEISTLIWVLLFGHYLEAKSSTAAGDALKEVAKLLPQTAHLVKGRDTVDVPVAQLQVEDVVLIKPGEKVPADGVIIQGDANFDESLISGESKPVAKKKADSVIAGSICQDGSVQVSLKKIGANSTVGQIQALIKTAQTTKPTAQTLADTAAKYLTFVALTVAIITILVWAILLAKPLVFALTLAITVLVIACPHALGLAIPTVSTIATTLAVKNGLFIKNMKKLEVVRHADYILFDKTGTLTTGKFGVSQVVPLSGTAKKILQLAAGLEAHSSHVIGNSIVSHAKAKKITPASVKQFKNLAGRGLKGQIGQTHYYLGNSKLIQQTKAWSQKLQRQLNELEKDGSTVVILSTQQKVLGFITLSDQIKPESKTAVAALHQLDVKVAMLTGDNQSVAKSVATQLGIDTFFAQVQPEDKYKKVKDLQDQGNRVIMVGDGVNDAPALTQADVGVAIGAGTDIAVEAGDIVLTHSNPQSLVSLVILSRRVYRKMIENLLWALGYNVLAIPAAAGLFIPLGFQLKPAVGALLMSLSSVIVVLNALTLKKANLKP